MYADTIPLDVWLGYFDQERKTFVSNTCVSVVQLAKIDRSLVPTQTHTIQSLECSELVLGINNILNTDRPLWLEGINEDSSNVYLANSEEFGPVYQIFIDPQEMEEGLPECESNEVFVFLVRPKFDIFLNSDKPGFMEVIMNPHSSGALLDGKGVKLGRPDKEDAPTLTLMLLNEESPGELHYLTTPTTTLDITKIAICRYLNRIIPGFMHEDMIDKIISINLREREDNTETVTVCLGLFGQYWLINAIVDLSLTDEDEEVEDVDFE